MMFYRFDRYMFATLLSRVMTRFQCGEVSAFNRMTEVGLNVPIRVYDARLVAIWDPNITLEQMEPFDAQVSFPAFDQHNRAKSIKTHNIVDEYVKWIVRGGDISLADLEELRHICKRRNRKLPPAVRTPEQLAAQLPLPIVSALGQIANTRGSLGTTRQFGRYDQDSNDRVALHAQQLDGLRGEIELLGRDAQVTKDLLVEASNRLQSQAGQLHVHETAQNTVLSNLEARVHKLERKRDRTVYDRNIDQLIKHDKVGRK